MSHRYDAALAQRIEAKWQDYWQEHETFRAPNPGEKGFDASRPKRFVMDMFPYPSGVGLHVGHPLGYIATDIYARFLRMRGANVLHPMGFDAFGLPAEQFAIQTGQHPRITTERNIATMRRQMRRLGLGHDPRRFVATTDPSFYKWTQWIFLQIFGSWYDAQADRARPIAELIAELESGARKPYDPEVNPEGRPWSELSAIERRRIVDNRRLAYLARVPVNWCPALGTVLANEEVTADGRSERGNHPVFKRPLEQWMMRITEYCERLLRDLEPLDWPEPIKLMQRNWIGRSEGAEVDFLAVSTAGNDVASWFSARESGGFPDRPSDDERAIRVFTTRPDTLYGATYMVLAPEHPLVDSLVPETWPSDAPLEWRGRFPNRPADEDSPRAFVAAYRRFAASRSDVDRQIETREKTGAFTGAYAINPVNGERIPIFIADYVLMGYGTGAIMAVPAHDSRDFEFARQFSLPIPPVVLPPREWLRERAEDGTFAKAGIAEKDPARLEAMWREAAGGSRGASGFVVPVPYEDDGVAIGSEVIDGRPTPDAKARITSWLAERGLGRKKVQYRLRDWLFSRQRYWGEPFPILYDEHGLPVPVPERELPVELPDVDDYTPAMSDDPEAPPVPPLARAREWAEVTIDGKKYRRELNTMPNWAGSCWYYLRYLDPQNDERFAAPEVERYWMLSPGPSGERPERWTPDKKIGGVDLYVGGAEHAVLHLLYSRFWHKVLFDLGHVSTPEPFHRLFNQGYVQAAAYTDERGVYVEAAQVEERDGRFFYEGREVQREFGKMGKSLKNAITPDDICESYGADTLRLYEMYMGPLEASKPWNTRDIIGVYRFLQRLWRNLVNEQTGELRVSDDAPASDLLRLLHRTIDGVRRDMESLGFNTAIAKLIELNNALTPLDKIPRAIAEPLVLMLAPLAPHIAEELWSKLRGPQASSLAYEPFPAADPSLLVEESIEVPVMIRGKVRARIEIAPNASAKEMEEAALAHPRVKEELEGKTVRKIIAVPGKTVSIVV